MNAQLDYDFSWEELHGCLLHKDCRCIEDTNKTVVTLENERQQKVAFEQIQRNEHPSNDDGYWKDNKDYIANLITKDRQQKH